MSNTKSIAIVGVGGQGTVLTSDILIEGLVDLGFDVKKTEQHGLSQRGGSVNCMVKYGDAVYAPIIADGEADVVVAFENCSGLKSMLLTDEENPDVYDALARRYLGIGCSCMSPNPNRLAMLDKLIDEFHVDGVVDIILQACHTYNVETALVGKLVKEKKGIPYTVVETDYSQSDVGQIQTRMAAFVEML